MGNNKLSEKEREIIVKLYMEKKLGKKDIAEMFNITLRTIDNIMKRYREETGNDVYRLNQIGELPMKDIIDLYENHPEMTMKEIKEIANEYNVSLDEILSRLDKEEER